MAPVWPQHALVPGPVTAALALALALVATWLELLPIYTLILTLYAVYCNLGRRAAGPSAYSVFNEGQRALPGTMHAAELDALLRSRSQHGERQPSATHWFDADNIVSGAVYEGPPVARNDMCPCGSGAKYKRCCGDPKKQNLFYGLDEDED